MKELQSRLQELGLSGREAEVYLALLKKRELSAPEISKITTITRTKSYEILQNLIKKGLCNETYKNGIKVFSSIDPTIAIQNMLALYEDELNRKRNIAEQFREELLELHLKKENIDHPLDYIEVLTDKGQIRDRLMTIQQKTKSELLAFTKPPYSMGNVEDNIEEEKKLFKKSKPTVKSIYEYEGLTSEEINSLIKMIELYQELGEEARIINKLPMKLAISDETVVIFALNDRVSLKPSITSMIVDHPSFAFALKKVFESYWEIAIPIEEFKRNLTI